MNTNDILLAMGFKYEALSSTVETWRRGRTFLVTIEEGIWMMNHGTTVGTIIGPIEAVLDRLDPLEVWAAKANLQ